MKLYLPTIADVPTLIEAWRRRLDGTTHQHFQEQILAQLESDPKTYLAQLDGAVIQVELELEDGSKVSRLPSISRYMWVDNAPVGRISLRYQPGQVELPPHVLGHIGYETFPWAQRQGYGTSALGQMLDIARERCSFLSYVELTTNADNLPSQKIITANGGIFIEEFEKPATSGGGLGRRYRITL